MMHRTTAQCGILALIVTCGLLAAQAIAQPAAAPPTTRPADATPKPAAIAATKPAATTKPSATQPANVAKPTASAPSTAPAAPLDLRPIGMGRGDREVVADTTAKCARFWPSFDSATMAWFAAIVILALSVRPRQFFSIRTLDALVLAGICLLMLFRGDVATHWSGKTAQWWAYLGLTLGVAYWVARGFVLVSVSRAVPLAGNLPAGSTLVLFLAGLALCLHQIATAPLSESSRDGLVGGLCVLDTGQLPYGERTLATRHTPVVALLSAGACRLAPPAMPDPASAGMIPMTWANHTDWADEDWADGADVTPARLVNGVLFLILLASVLVIGQRLYSAECGLEMAALLCVFPGTLESITDPAVLAPAALVAVATSLTLLPGLGSLLGAFAFVFAGLAWPWAWLGVPIVLAYSFRHGLQALGCITGLAAGVALLVIGINGLVEPTLPRPYGALRLAGEPATYSASIDSDQRLVIEKRASQPEANEDRAATAFLWRALLSADKAAVKPTGASDAKAPASMPADAKPGEILFRDLSVRDDARDRVQTEYREGVAGLAKPAQFVIRLRTALEAVWMPVAARETASPTPWELWSHGEDDVVARWLTIRRAAKVVAVLLSLAAALAVFWSPKPRGRQVAGALMATVAAVMLAASHGAAAHLLLLAPAVLMAWAAYDRDAASRFHETHSEPPVEAGMPPAPRISNDAGSGAAPAR